MTLKSIAIQPFLYGYNTSQCVYLLLLDIVELHFIAVNVAVLTSIGVWLQYLPCGL